MADGPSPAASESSGDELAEMLMAELEQQEQEVSLAAVSGKQPPGQEPIPKRARIGRSLRTSSAPPMRTDFDSVD